MPLRDIASYPPQEPFSEIGEKYNVEAQRLSAGIDGACVAYGEDPYQEVAVFPADNPSGIVLAFMHGGGWVNGYKEWPAFMAPALNEAGVTFVSIGYRLAPTHKWPTGLMDAATAVKWIHENISEYGGDPQRLFISGHSAGGHYASWLAVRSDWQDKLGVPDNVIRGALPVSGVYDFTPGNGMAIRPRFLDEDGADDMDASPLHTISKAPPFFMTWGDNDIPHLIPQAEQMADALRSADADVTTLVLAGCDHLEASYECGKAEGRWLPDAVSWMAAH